MDSLRAKLLLVRFLSGLPLGFVGTVTGFLTGASRAPAVSALLPAVLTFTGMLVVYFVGKGSLPRALVAGFGVFLFSVNLLVGSVLGSASRDRHDDFLESIEWLKSKAEQEFVVRKYREGLGLPPDPPSHRAQATSSEKP